MTKLSQFFKPCHRHTKYKVLTRCVDYPITKITLVMHGSPFNLLDDFELLTKYHFDFLF